MNRNPHQIETAIYPSPSGWVKTRWRSGGPESEPHDIEGKSSADYCGFPSRAFVSVPLWIQSEDEDLIEQAIVLQLEKWQLKPTTDPCQFAWKLIRKLEGRVLVQAVVFNESLTTQTVSADHYVPFANLFHHPVNGISLWEENGRFTVGFSESGSLIHFQTLTGRDGSGLANEAFQTGLQLTGERIVSGKGELKFLGDIPANVEEAFRKRFSHLEIGNGKLILQRRQSSIDFLPRYQKARRKTIRRRKTVVRLIAAIVLGYMGIISLFGGQYFKRSQQLAEKRQQVATQSKPLDEIRAIRDDWRILAETIVPEEFPLEIVDRCVAVLPPEGIELRSFQINNEQQVTVVGEAKSLPLALQFKEELLASSELSNFRWEFPQPKETNQGAIFSVIGNRLN